MDVAVTEPSLADALRAKGFGSLEVKTPKVLTEPIPGSTVVTRGPYAKKTCPFCKVETGNLFLHAQSCLNNPNRPAVINPTECPRCHGQVSKRGFPSHLKACDGVDRTEQRIQQTINHQKRRMIKAGAKIVTKTSTKTKSVIGVSRSDERLSEPDLPITNLVDFLEVMERHLSDSDVSFKEFNGWVDITSALWNRV